MIKNKTVKNICLGVYYVIFILLPFMLYNKFTNNFLITYYIILFLYLPLMLYVNYNKNKKGIFKILDINAIFFLIFLFIPLLYKILPIVDLLKLRKGVVTYFIFLIYIITMYTFIKEIIKTKKYDKYVYIFITIVLIVGGVYTSDYIQEKLWQNMKKEEPNVNIIGIPEVDYQTTKNILKQYYIKDEIVISTGIKRALNYPQDNVLEPNFYYDKFNFTNTDIKSLENIKGIEKVELRTNYHNLVSEKFIPVNRLEKEEYMNKVPLVLKKYYPEENYKTIEATYTPLGGQIVDLNESSPLTINSGIYYSFDQTKVKILNGELPKENYEILIPNIFSDLYLKVNPNAKIEDVLNKEVTNAYNNQRYKIVGIYDFATYVGPLYNKGQSSQILQVQYFPPIYVYHPDDLNEMEKDRLYEQFMLENNKYYTKKGMIFENDEDLKEATKFNTYNNFKNNEIVITLKGDANIKEVLNNIKGIYPNNQIIYYKNEINNVYNMRYNS